MQEESAGCAEEVKVGKKKARKAKAKTSSGIATVEKPKAAIEVSQLDYADSSPQTTVKPKISISAMNVESLDNSSFEDQLEKKEPSAAQRLNQALKKANKPKKKKYAIDKANLPTISMEEVKKHSTNTDCWSVVDELVYNVTNYIPFHPGGKKKIMLGAGRDAT